MTGLDEFKRVLKEYKNLSLWAAGSSIVFPFVASFLAIIPPWPKGLNVITAIAQLVALIVVYQGFKTSHARVTRTVRNMAALLAIVVLAYMASFTMFTIYVPQAQRSIVIGYECLTSAKKVFGDKCPFLTVDDLSTVAFDEFLIWTRVSVTVVRTGLIALWFSLFICLAVLIGNFLIFQMRTKAK